MGRGKAAKTYQVDKTICETRVLPPKHSHTQNSYMGHVPKHHSGTGFGGRASPGDSAGGKAGGRAGGGTSQGFGWKTWSMWWEKAQQGEGSAGIPSPAPQRGEMCPLGEQTELEDSIVCPGAPMGVMVTRAWSCHILESQNPPAIKVTVKPEGPPELCCHPTPPTPPQHITPFKPVWNCDMPVAKHLCQHPWESWNREGDGGKGEGGGKFVLI